MGAEFGAVDSDEAAVGVEVFVFGFAAFAVGYGGDGFPVSVVIGDLNLVFYSIGMFPGDGD